MRESTYRDRLRERARRQHGYVTPRDAKALGIPAVELRKIASRGGVQRRGWGVYRFDNVPLTDASPYMEAVLRVGPGAHIVGESVLALHDLALVNPATIRVASPRRVRVSLPRTITLVEECAEDDEITTYDGIPSMTVAGALRDARHTVMRRRLLEAVDEAESRGLVNRREARTLRSEFTAPAR